MTIEEALKPIDSAVWETSEVFDGLQDEDVWVRAHPNLLSIGELASHVAYGVVTHLKPDIESPVLYEGTRYYLHSVEKPTQLEIGAVALYEEVKRLFAICREEVVRLRPDLEFPNPNREGWTWGYTLEYMAFHVAYHTGQMYSVRHLMGHETANN